MACLGLLDDAAPLFGSGTAIPRAGVLLALPALIAGGVFECARKIYGSLGPAFYGLRTSLLTLLLMALWRIKRPEGIKEHSPHRSKAIAALCEELNRSNTRFPGSSLRLHYAVREPI